MTATLKMKELESRTGVNREAIRFYIKEGLLPEPEKPKKNVAFYSEDHVTRILLIKRLQDEHFLPLKVVKAILNSSDGAAMVAQDERPGLAFFLPSLLKDTPPAPDKSLEDLVNDTSLSKQQVKELIKVGAINLTDQGLVDYRDAAIAELWGKAQDMGFDTGHGYTADYLGRYVEAMQTLAEFEASHFLRQFGNDLNGRAAAELGASGIELANKIISLLRTKFVARALVGDDSTSKPK